MEFIEIEENEIKVGDPLRKELVEKIRSSFLNHETRIGQMEIASGGVVEIFNGDIDFNGFSTSDPYIYHYKARRSFSVADFRGQLLGKSGSTSGYLKLRLEKSSSSSPSSFSSILTSDQAFNFATASEYQEETALIDGSLNTVSIGDILRIRVVEVPANYKGKIVVRVGGE